MNELALFAGAGGGILGGHLLGWRTVCAVERDPYCASVLVARQNDKTLPAFPIWDDVQTFDGKPWRGVVDVVSGGFPCQDISIAGKGVGIQGERSGLWKHMARIIGEVRPRYVFAENSPVLRTRGLDIVLKDLAEMGYDAKWCVLGAKDVGAPHKRDRIWILAYTDSLRELQQERSRQDKWRWTCDCCEQVAYTSIEGLQTSEYQAIFPERRREERRTVTQQGWWSAEPDVGRVANGIPHRVDRLKALGNGQVPAVAKLALEALIAM
jgi:DNA (cytosine-5)-methyltransferase 1